MSKSLPSSLPSRVTVFVCYNPQCLSQHKAFATEKAFSMHLSRSPQCLSYLCSKSATPRNVDAEPVYKHRRPQDAFDETVFKCSKKRSKPLRCDVVNESIAMQSFTTLMPSIAFNPEDDEFDIDAYDDNEEDDNSINDIELRTSQSTTVDAQPQSVARFIYTSEQKWTIALLKLLVDMNAPDYAFTSILKWARDAQEDGYSFFPAGGQSRVNNVDLLFKSVANATRLLPSVVTVDTPHGPPCKVIAYEFAPQLLKLLQDPSVMTQQNLLIDITDPLAPYESPNGVIGDAISGLVYRDAYKRLITNPKQQLFVPIIQWIDRTSVTGNDRFSLKPYMFTPAIFKEPFRRTIEAWGYHGFIPKPRLSTAQNKSLKQGDNVRNYHAQLYTVLRSFSAAHASLTNVLLPIGPNGSMRVDIITCILFVIQDMQEGDALCGRFGVHTPGIQRQCRACDVNYIDLDNHNVKCTFINAHEIKMIALDPDAEIRKRWSQHKLRNVFDFVPMMADPVRGIYGATPVETMHAFRKGMIEVVTFSVLNHVPPSKLAALDALAIKFHKSHRQTIRKTFPSTDFTQGITNLTKISAAERLGLVFLFVVLSQYDEGWEILNSTFAQRSHRKNSDGTVREIVLSEVIEVFEAMLCFDQWLNQSTYWPEKHHEESKLSVQESIQTLMQLCVDNIPLGEKKTWKFPKFHELLHVIDNMERFGAPINYCAQRPEALLRPVAKDTGRRSQRRHEGVSYELQAAQRLSYNVMINTVYAEIFKEEEVNDSFKIGKEGKMANGSESCSTGNATFATLTCDFNTGYTLCWHTQTSVSKMRIPDPVLQMLLCTFGSKVRFCTEIVYKGNTYRCHPSFQSGGPIYDWMNAKFCDPLTKLTSICPCRLTAVVITEEIQPYRLLVHRGKERTGVRSVLLTEWFMNDDYDVINPEEIEGPCFVIIIKEDQSKILQTRPRSEWACEFTTPIM